MERDRPGNRKRRRPIAPPEDPMARATGSHSRTEDTRFTENHAADPAPETDEISGTRADYAPAGADTKTTTGGTLKRTLKEFQEDNLTDWAAALTYYGVLALFPALIALLSIVGLRGRLHPRGQRRLRDARGPQDLEAQAAATADHAGRHPLRRRHRRDAG